MLQRERFCEYLTFSCRWCLQSRWRELISCKCCSCSRDSVSYWCRSGSCLRVMSSCLIASSSAKVWAVSRTTRSRPELAAPSPQPRCDHSEDQKAFGTRCSPAGSSTSNTLHLAHRNNGPCWQVLHQTIGDRLGHWGAGSLSRLPLQDNALHSNS